MSRKSTYFIFYITWIIFISNALMDNASTPLLVILSILPFIMPIYIDGREIIKSRNKMNDFLIKIPDYTATQHVFGINYNSGLAFDESSNIICLITKNENISYKLITQKDLISAEIFQDGISMTKTVRTSQMGGALVGGLMLGGVGAVIGGLSGNTITTSKIERVELRLTINDINNPLHDIIFAKTAIHEARKWLAIIDVLIKRDEMENRAKLFEYNAREQISVRSSIADELNKLADLRSAGILTEDEFQVQKQIVLNQNRDIRMG